MVRSQYGRRTAGEFLFDGFNVLLLFAVSLACAYPFVYVFFASISDPGLLLQHRGILLGPTGIDFEAYRMVFLDPGIGRGYANTIFIVFFGVLYNVTLTAFGAYALSRKKLLLKKLIIFMVIIPLYISGGLVPTYLNIRQLGMFNSLAALIIPSGISTTSLIVMRTNFAAIPDALEEAAKMDGANDIYILVRIVLPLSLPILAVMILFYGVGHWNSWFPASIYLQDRRKFPLQLILRQILLQNSTQRMTIDGLMTEKALYSEIVKYATTIVATVPLIIAYPFLQRYFVKGLLVGSLKG